MMKKIAILCTMTAMTYAAVAQSQQIEIDLPQAIEIALNENPTIKIANLEIERYDYVRKETIGNLMPSLAATGSYSRSIIKQKLGGMISIQGDNTFAGGASLGLPLFAPAVYATLKLNKEQMLGAVEAARGSRIMMVNEVKKSFYNILLAEQSLTVLLASEKTINETVENTRTMFNNGLAAEYDLITAEVQLSNLKPTIIQTRNSIGVATMLLKMYLSLPEDVDLSLKGDLNEFKSEILSSDGNFTTDISDNSDLKSLEIQQRMLEQQYRLARTQRMPTLAAFGDFQITGQDLNMSAFSFGGGAPAEAQKHKYNWQKPLSVGVQLSVPIFSGLSKVNKEKQLKNNMEQLKMQRGYLEQSTSVQVRSSISNIITAREQMYANEKTVTQAKKAYGIANTRYKAGAGTILELNSAELSMTQAELNYTQAIYDYLSAQADYQMVIGQEK